jgi:hypothetical protein
MIIQMRLRVLLAIALGIAIASLYYMFSNVIAKKDCQQKTGNIVFLNKQFLNLPKKEDIGNYRYISINNYPFIFELKPAEQSQRIDSLQIGDEITLFYTDFSETSNVNINRSLQFIEKNNKLYYKEHGNENTIGMVGIAIAVLMAFISFLLFKKGTIAL